MFHTITAGLGLAYFEEVSTVIVSWGVQLMSKNIVFGLFLFVMALILAVMAWRMIKADRRNARLSIDAATWPVVTGQIVSARIDEIRSSSYDSNSNTDVENKSFEPKVDYTYTVADRHYEGKRINFSRLHFVREKRAHAVIANYTVGSTVSVAYNPADPQNSVLDRTTKPPKISFWALFMAIGAAVVAVLGVVMLNISVE